MYTNSKIEYVDIHGIRYAIRHWGNPQHPRLFFLHGKMDCSASFQFVVDALSRNWHIIAPDWRGHGQSEWLYRPYWFPDYYADLDALLNHYSQEKPADIVGHSMGGSIASIYAGIRPERVSRLMILDFLGLSPAIDENAPTLIDRWLRQIKKGDRQSVYANHQELAHRLMDTNPRLSEDKAHFLSQHIGRSTDDGSVEVAFDPWHRVISPLPYRIEDSLACWARIRAQVRLLIARYGNITRRFGHAPHEMERRLQSFPTIELEWVEDAGHNLQHDQPLVVAKSIDSFF